MVRSSATVAEVLHDGFQGTARYELRRLLGKGGMGAVYEAFDRERGQLVAVKTLLNFDAGAFYLFKQEFRTLADVRHRNLVRLNELVVVEGRQPFFTMELLRGTDFLRHTTAPEQATEAHTTSSPPPASPVLSRPAGAPDRETVRPAAPGIVAGAEGRGRRTVANMDRLRKALGQLAKGIRALHAAGKLHRDIKPSNVMVTPEGRVVLLDFGVATEMRAGRRQGQGGSGDVVGTVKYMAPEQALDEPPTAASDWYSVGVMLFEALAGRAPFVGSSADVLQMKNLVDGPAPSECVDGVPSDLDSLCRSLLRRDPSLRPRGAEIFDRLGLRQSTAPPPAPVGALGAGTALIGRESELEALRRAFDTVRAGGSVTVRVGGSSGMGKSAVAIHLLEELESAGEALVLRGRAYERESVPYKAVDSAMDALSRHLVSLDEDGAALALPDDIGALGQLFPVLQRVPGVPPPSESAGQAADDPHALRRVAFGALRTVMATLSERQPVVLFVDDAQWGDIDSALLLLELLRGPDAPPMLLLMTYRDNEDTTSPFLTELRTRWPEGADVRDVAIGPLDQTGALHLALTLLEGSDEMTQRIARAVARESRGSPFLIEELVRGNRGVASATGATLAIITLDDMIAQRMSRLSDEGRRLVEVVAVGGRPIPIAIASNAAGLIGPADDLVAVLSSQRFTRTGLRDGREVVEMAHDRIRETVAHLLPSNAMREHHRRLAGAFGGMPGADDETIALHWSGAGDDGQASRYAERAAESAAQKLAFDHAANLLRLALRGADARRAQALRVRLAEVLALAGRATDSARVYLEAADGAAEAERVEYQRAAAGLLLSAGHIDEGERILRGVLAAVGMSVPRSPLAAVFWLVLYRIWIAALGLRIKERAPSEISLEARLRVDVLCTVSEAFAVVNLILAACMQARHFIEAVRYGDRYQVVRALSIEAAQIAARGQPERRRERALVQLGRELAEREGTVEARAYLEGAWGIGLFMRGLWKPARAGFLARESAAGLPSSAAQNRLFLARTYYFTGQLRECSRREAILYAAARDRGDLYTTVNMRTSTGLRRWLVADDPARARRELAEALAQWSQKGFLVQHWQAMVYGCDIHLYAGDGVAADAWFSQDLRALKRSQLLRSGWVRIVTLFTRGRVAIASLESCAGPARAARLREAWRCASALRREYNPWAAMLAALIEAAASQAQGDRKRAIRALREAIERAEATDTIMYAHPARYRLGELLGDEEGRELVRVASEALSAEGIRDPARWTAVALPGRWGGSHGPGSSDVDNPLA